MIIEEIIVELEKLVGDKQENIVIYAALWPLMRIVNIPGKELAHDLCSCIMRKFAGRTLMMPTFTLGFDKDGNCDLDLLPSQTGALSENFRLSIGVKRTRSAFFSFAVNGPNAATLISLKPNEAWGVGSLYEWLYNHNASILTLGLHPTHCSYTHYAEWLMRDKIPYRFNKKFSGTLICEQVSMSATETLFVRQRDPEPINDFTHLLPGYIDMGMKYLKPYEYPISCIRAKAKIDVVSSAINRNSLALISNKEQFLHYVR